MLRRHATLRVPRCSRLPGWFGSGLLDLAALQRVGLHLSGLLDLAALQRVGLYLRGFLDLTTLQRVGLYLSGLLDLTALQRVGLHLKLDAAQCVGEGFAVISGLSRTLVQGFGLFAVLSGARHRPPRFVPNSTHPPCLPNSAGFEAFLEHPQFHVEYPRFHHQRVRYATHQRRTLRDTPNGPPSGFRSRSAALKERHPSQ